MPTRGSPPLEGEGLGVGSHFKNSKERSKGCYPTPDPSPQRGGGRKPTRGSPPLGGKTSLQAPSFTLAAVSADAPWSISRSSSKRKPMLQQA